jgi:hypothetical protein
VIDGTPFGPVTGEIVILPETAALTKDLGVEVKVKQVTVRRELFGMETWGRVMARVAGEVNADFLPVTSDRTGFLKDSEEYRAFLEVMEKVMADVKTFLQKLTARKEGKRVSRALKDALQRIYRSLSMNPDLSPFGPLPVGEASKSGGDAASISREREGSAQEVKPAGEAGEPEKAAEKKRKKKPKVRRLTPNAIIKKMKFGETGVQCVVDSFGEEGPEAFSEETTIYINRDHPLYKRESGKVETHTLNLARLITQEIALMKDPRNPRQAFERQSKLLKDAFIGAGD